MPAREECTSVTKAVSGASHRLNQLGWVIVVDLPPQAPHQHLEHVREWVVVLIPHMGGNRRAIDDLTWVQDKKLEQREFLGSELYGFAGAPHPVRLQIDFEIGNAQGFREWSSAPSSQRPHSRQQLTERERLGQIIVRTHLESRHPVVDGVARGEHENWRSDFARSELATEIESIPSGQHHIENEHVEAAERGFHLPLRVARHRHHLNTVLRETGLDDGGQARVVFHQKNSHDGQFTSPRVARSPETVMPLSCNDDDSFAPYHSPVNRRQFPASGAGCKDKPIGGVLMFKVIALAVAIAATTSVAGAQVASTVSKSTVKTGTVAKRHSRVKKEESQATLLKEAKVSEATARATALKEVPNGTVKSSEIERENGKLIYSFDITVPGKTGIDEVNVNAIDGSVVARSHEGGKAEKKEKAEEAKEKKAK